MRIPSGWADRRLGYGWSTSPEARERRPTSYPAHTRGNPSETLTARKPFRVVQPWGKDPARQSTLLSEHATAGDAFAEIDRLAEQMLGTGDRPDAIELVVVNADGAVVRRLGAH